MEAEAANFQKLEAEAEAEAMEKLPLPDTLIPTSHVAINDLPCEAELLDLRGDGPVGGCGANGKEDPFCRDCRQS